MENQKIVLWYEVKKGIEGLYNMAPSDVLREKFNKYDLQELFDKNNGKDVEIKCFKDKQECGLVKGKITTGGFDSLEGDIKYDSENSCSGSFFYFIDTNELALNGRGRKKCNGRVYEGEFINAGCPYSCKSTLTYVNGDVYKGEFGDDYLPDGEGKLTYNNGDVYEGEFKNGRPNGKGKLTCNNGDVYKGEFKDGILDPENRDNNVSSDSEEIIYNVGNGHNHYYSEDGDVSDINNKDNNTSSEGEEIIYNVNEHNNYREDGDVSDINNNNANQAGEPSIKNQCILF